MGVVFMVVMSRGGDGTLKGDTSGHYNLHILPSGQQTVGADKYGELYYQKKTAYYKANTGCRKI